MFAPENIALHADLLKIAEEKVAFAPKTLPLLAAGAVAAGVPVHYLTKHHDEEAKRRAMQASFGAGTALGLSTPKILRGVLNAAEARGLVAPDSGGQ